MLLPACGGGSFSSSAGASDTGSRTYQQGYAAGTVDTVDLLLADLRALQASLAGSGAPVQISGGTRGRSLTLLTPTLLTPRQRHTLAESLLTFIARVTAARNVASAAGAGRAEAEVAQTATEEALQVVVAADTAARVAGGAPPERRRSFWAVADRRRPRLFRRCSGRPRQGFLSSATACAARRSALRGSGCRRRMAWGRTRRQGTDFRHRAGLKSDVPARAQETVARHDVQAVRLMRRRGVSCCDGSARLRGLYPARKGLRFCSGAPFRGRRSGSQ